MTAIILVNWNGADDTLACLDSLSAMSEPHFVIVADNASTDDSVLRIQSWIDAHRESRPVVRSYELLRLDANYGFAVANNKALSVALKHSPDYCLLLNNDTEVEPDFLSRLVSFATAHPKYKVLSPCIRYFADKDKVWFAGGELTFLSRQVPYKDKPVSTLPGDPYPISFVSGCALFFHPSLLDRRGELFYNGFFFGEEDYELCLRLQTQDVEMACVPQSIVYHKVGSSQKNTNDSRGLGRAYMYYHNRLICVRMHSSRFKFHLIRMLTSANCLRYFKSYTGSWRLALKIVRHLMVDTTKKEGFSYADFRSLMFDGDYFPFATPMKR